MYLEEENKMIIEEMYQYLERYVNENAMNQTSEILPYALRAHEGQYRKGKDNHVPYIHHPLLIACHALALGLNSDNLVSAALLHDVCEDCNIKVEELPVNEETKEIVALLTKNKAIPMEQYYSKISQNADATIIKLLDRCNNVSEMSRGFNKEKISKYILETETWFYPLMQTAIENFPQYARQIFLIKYHINSVLEAIKNQ